MVGRPLNALLIEDSEDDALLLVRTLGEQGFDVTWDRVQTGPAMKDALQQRDWAVVLSDFRMPKFNAPAALRVLQDSGQDLPFIVISGTIGEETAVETMKAGAHDYLMKGSLKRLGEAIRRETREAQIRRERQAGIEKIEHLNRVLSAIRSINQLIVREKDPVQLIEECCECLVETGVYNVAWIALLDDQHKATAVAGRGCTHVWADLAENLEHGKMPFCVAQALLSSNVVILDEQNGACQDCVIQRAGAHKTLTVRIEHQDRVYGVMAVTLIGGVPIDESESSLFEEVAGDIGFALWSIETERARRTEEEKFRVTFDNANIGIVLTTPDGRLARVNQAFCDLLGYSRAELEAKDFTSITHPDDHAISRDAVQCLLAGERARFRLEKRYLHKDGRPVWADISTILLHKQDGNPDQFVTHVLDITERRNMQIQVAQSDRLATMGMLAAGVAHEINNPLCYILYNLESLTDDLPRLSAAMQRCLEVVFQQIGEEDWAAAMGPHLDLFNPAMLDDIRDRFNDALQGTHRIKEIARGLGTFSRVEQDRLVPVNLRNVIEVAINMVFNEIKYRSRLVKEYGKTSSIMANDGKLSQVFLNLLVNAAHSIVDGGVESNEIRVRTWQEGDHVFAEVRDTGKGIAKEHLPHLFEPFFTTKEIGVGTGLGLSISKSIIEGYGGSIEAKSKVGKGTSFIVRLPVQIAEDSDEASVPDHTVVQLDVRGRILVIDDEAGIRAAMTRMLRGHDVVEAESGEAARKILEADQAFDLVLCDMMMPRMSGVELHEWLSATYPDLARQIVFVTGGAFTPSARDYLAKVSNIRLEKPFDMANFKKIVAELIVANRKRKFKNGD